MNSSPKSQLKPRSTTTIVLRTIEIILAAVILAIIFVIFWGDGLLSRPRPSDEGYISSYFDYFDKSQIEKLDFEYKGMFRGIFTLGRAQFKGPVDVTKAIIEQKIKKGLISEETYDPVKTTEGDKLWLRHECETLAGGSLPSWFDFPFNRKMRILREASDGQLGDHPEPRYEKVWYIDDEKNVVYVRANWG